jgi:predicted enzyme related to lactoylglutathione lyase
MASTARHVLTVLAVEDLARARAFYLAAFGWGVVVDAAVYVELAVAGGMRLGLYDRVGFARNTGLPASVVGEGGTTATEVYFQVDELEPAIDRMRAAGARELSALAVRPWGDEAIYFSDPDGNVLVLARPLER